MFIHCFYLYLKWQLLSKRPTNFRASDQVFWTKRVHRTSLDFRWPLFKEVQRFNWSKNQKRKRRHPRRIWKCWWWDRLFYMSIDIFLNNNFFLHAYSSNFPWKLIEWLKYNIWSISISWEIRKFRYICLSLVMKRNRRRTFVSKVSILYSFCCYHEIDIIYNHSQYQNIQTIIVINH